MLLKCKMMHYTMCIRRSPHPVFKVEVLATDVIDKMYIGYSLDIVDVRHCQGNGVVGGWVCRIEAQVMADENEDWSQVGEKFHN